MPDVTTPVVIDLGKQKKKRLRELRDGRGPLAEEVRQTVAETIERLGPAAEGKSFVPIVLVYRRKSPRRGLSLLS